MPELNLGTAKLVKRYVLVFKYVNGHESNYANYDAPPSEEDILIALMCNYQYRVSEAFVRVIYRLA